MARSVVPVELPGDPTADLHAATKVYVDTGLALKPGVPYFGPVPAGSTTATIVHGLGTNDVDVTVYRVADGLQVGVPVDRVDADTVALTFVTAPTSGQYRIVVSAGTGSGGPGGGGGGAPDPHAVTHAAGGSDPVSPGSIGAAETAHTHEGDFASATHDHVGVYSSVVHTHSGLAPTGGTTGQVLAKDSNEHYDFSWQDPTGGGGGGPSAIKPYPPIVLPLEDYLAPNGVNYKIIRPDAAQGTHFRVNANVACNMIDPINPTPGQTILFELRNVYAGGHVDVVFSSTNTAGWVHPHTWSYGDVAVGTTIFATTDYVTAIYDERAASGAGRWRIIGVTKGFPN